MRLDAFAAVLLEVAATLLVLIGKAAWTDQAVLWMFVGSVLCWAVCGVRTTSRWLRSRSTPVNRIGG